MAAKLDSVFERAMSCNSSCYSHFFATICTASSMSVYGAKDSPNISVAIAAAMVQLADGNSRQQQFF